MRKLRKKLAQIHEELPRRLAQVEGSRIKLELTNISLVQQRIFSGLSRVETTGDTTSQHISNILEAQERHNEALQLSQQLQHRINSSIEEIRTGTVHRLDRLESAFSINSGPQPSALGMPRISIKGEDSNLSGPITSGAVHQTVHSVTEINTQTLRSTYHSLSVQTRYRRPSSCNSACRCRCHMRQTVGTPSFLSGLIGQLFIGYKGMPTVAQPCTENNCKRSSEPSLFATYCFPTWWILDRMMLIIARLRANLGPEVILRFPRYISRNSEVALFVQQGKIDSLKTCVIDGKGSPNDLISMDSSTSLLQVRFPFS